MKWSIEKKMTVGLGVALAFLLVNALVSYRATRKLIEHERLVSHTHQALTELEATLSTMKDAETGERGYIITGDESYLAPYHAAIAEINDHVAKLRQLTADNHNQLARIPVLEQKIAARLSSLEKGISLKKDGGAEGPRQHIASGVGKMMMDDLRSFVAVI
jgi:CHASE3 domain sensor protein